MIDVEDIKTYLRNTLAQNPKFSSQPDSAKVLDVETYGRGDGRFDLAILDGRDVVVVEINIVVNERRDTNDPLDPRVLPLWEIFNGWYSDVTFALRHCAQRVLDTDRGPLTDSDKFVVGAHLYYLERTGQAQVTPMDATWADTVDIAYEALLDIANGSSENEGLHEWIEKFGTPLGGWEETARLVLLATGSRP